MLASDTNIESNLVSSIESFLYTNVVIPYNAAVVGTNYADELTIRIDDPDDPATIATTPVITIPQPEDYATPVSTGMGDREVWNYKSVTLKCYPDLATDGIALKPSINSTSILRSLFYQISTALTIPLYDFTQTPPALMDAAYLTQGRIIRLHGAITKLAIDKHRFDYELKFRFPLLTLNG